MASKQRKRAKNAARSEGKPKSRKSAAKKSAAGTTARKSRPRQSAPRKPAAKSSTPLARLRTICLALPEATEVEAWGEPTFRVNGKLFAMHASPSNHHGGGRQSVWIYATHVEQDLVLRARPDRYFKPPYVGPSGWIGAWLDGSPPWREITELLRGGYRQRAPKKLAAKLGAD
jgi:hypothetical protein